MKREQGVSQNEKNPLCCGGKRIPHRKRSNGRKDEVKMRNSLGPAADGGGRGKKRSLAGGEPTRNYIKRVRKSNKKKTGLGTILYKGGLGLAEGGERRDRLDR